MIAPSLGALTTGEVIGRGAVQAPAVGAVKQGLPANDICAKPRIAVCRALVDAGAAGAVQISQAAGRAALLHTALGWVRY